MKIIITDFDGQFFIKKQYLMNVLMGFMSFLSSYIMEDGIVRYMMMTLDSVIIILSFIFRFFLFSSKNVIDYSKHRICGLYLISFVFLSISMSFSASFGLTYLFVILFSYILFYFYIHFSALKKYTDERFEFFMNAYNNNNGESLLNYFESKNLFENNDGWSILKFYALFISVQFGTIVGLTVVRDFSISFKVILIGLIFLFLSCLIVWVLKYNVIPPYQVLVKCEEKNS